MNKTNKNYERKVLYKTDAFEIVSIQWEKNSISELHSHGWSHCHVLIEEGLFENQLDLGLKKEIRLLEPGQVITTPIGAKHEVICKSEKGKTLHVYSPPVSELKIKERFSSVDCESLYPELSLSEPIAIHKLEKLLQFLKTQTVSTNSPYFMNQLFAGILPQTLMAEEFIAHTRTTLATYEASSIHTKMEVEVIQNLSQQIGWPTHSSNGISVPGGSAANFMAVHCAREKLIPEAKEKGVGGRTLKVFVSQEAHYSFKKALAVLGIGSHNLIQVPSHESGQMLVNELKNNIQNCLKNGDIPLMVGATAGTTVLGAFDEFTPTAEICKEFGVWLHIDGAWGGPAIFSEKLRPLIKGLELADSMTFDAHKLFGSNLTSSFFLTKHKDILFKANNINGGEYLFHTDDSKLDRGQLSWQCGRRADATSFWTLWKNVGTKGLGDFVDRLIDLRDEILTWVATQPRLQIVAQPHYLNICLRVASPYPEKDSNWSQKVRERLIRLDQAMVNYSGNSEGSFLRLILAHPYLEFKHVRQILEWALEV